MRHRGDRGIDWTVTADRARRAGWGTAALVAALLAGCAWLATPSADAMKELAPTGSLRVAMVFGSVPTPSQVTRDPATGAPRGVPVDLATQLAERMGVPLEIVLYPTLARLLESAGASAWDVTFVPLDPARRPDLDAGGPYAMTGSTFLVPSRSAILGMAEIDRPGVRVAVQGESPQDHDLTRLLRSARLVRAPGPEAAFTLLAEGHADAVSLGRPLLLALAESRPGFRVLDGNYSSYGHVAALPRGRPLGAAYVNDFIERARTSGAVWRALEAAGLRGVEVPTGYPRKPAAPGTSSWKDGGPRAGPPSPPRSSRPGGPGALLDAANDPIGSLGRG